MWHVYLAANDPEIGHNDADHDLKTLISVLKPKIPSRIKTEAVESALYSCNLMDEAGKFWHPEGKTFDRFIKDMAINSRQHAYYNRFYNYFEERAEQQDGDND